MVAAIALYKVVAEWTEDKETHSIGTHNHCHGKLSINNAPLSQPLRQDRYKHIDRHGKQHVGKQQPPEVMMPQPQVYGSVLSIHLVRFAVVGEASVFHSPHIVAHTIGDGLSYLCKMTEKLRFE